MGSYHKCNNQGRHEHKCKTKTIIQKYLKVTATTIRSMDIEHMSANQSLTGHQTSKPR